MEARSRATEAKEEAMLAKIEAKEEAFEKERCALEAEKEAMKSRDTSDADILELNVGGKKVDVCRKTMCLIEGSMLASQFSGRWEDSMKKGEDGRIFLNYDPDKFKLILSELRECEMDPEHELKMPDPSVKGLWKYLGLEAAVVPVPPVFTESTILLTDDHKKAVFEMLPGAESESVVMERLYHCSGRDGSSAEFHRTCDGKGATIAIMRCTNGFICGGYNSESWEAGTRDSVAAGAFVFSLTNPAGTEPTKYVVEDPTKVAVFNSSRGRSYGPWFTGSSGGYLGCVFGVGQSFSQFPDNYVDTTGRGHATFTGFRYFTLDKMEVWSVLPKTE
jgi:hypothetical protein